VCKHKRKENNNNNNTVKKENQRKTVTKIKLFCIKVGRNTRRKSNINKKKKTQPTASSAN
jgi:hypothetical protein